MSKKKLKSFKKTYKILERNWIKKWKTKRCICNSRLDYLSANSAINQTELGGFLNLWNTILIFFFFWDVYVRYAETGRFLDVMLAKLMFEKVYLLMLIWMKCFLVPFTHFFLYKLFFYRKLSRFQIRFLQYLVEFLLVFNTYVVCSKQKWTILPCSFVTLVTLIHVMKMHSFMESQLDIYDDYIRNVVTAVKQEKKSECYLQEPFIDTYTESILRVSTEFFVKDHCLPNTYCATCMQHPVEGPSFTFFLYYLCCPVLVYETCFPCSDSPRPLYILSKLFKMIATLNALYIISVRYLIPVVQVSTSNLFILGFARIMWPILFGYFLIFYFLFECVCNLLAEITCFGHRNFYHDWWNSTTFEEFSRKWNRPVHEFLRKHIYKRTQSYFKMNKLFASTITFFVSALFHEFIMIVCFKHVSFWMFTFMMLQIPLTFCSRINKQKNLANSVFWLQMILGVPLIAFLYSRAYTRYMSQKNQTSFIIEEIKQNISLY